MSGPFADTWEIGSQSVTVARPWPSRALEIHQAYRREVESAERTRQGIAKAPPEQHAGLSARYLAQRDAASGYLVAALVVDPAPPAARPDERPAAHWRRAWRWLEESGWTVDEAHTLHTLLDRAVLQGLRHAPTAVAYSLSREWSSAGGTLDYVLARAGRELLGDPAAVTRRRTSEDEPTAWERLDPALRESTVALLLAEVRRG